MLPSPIFSRVSLSLTLLTSTIAIGWIFVPWLIQHVISTTFVLSPEINPELFSGWIKTPMPITFSVYLFNVSNPAEVQQGALPKLVEIGPYVFEENKTKTDIVTDEEKDTLTYLEYISYHFDQNRSAGLTLDDEVTIINVPFVAAAIKISELPWPLSEIGRTVLIQHQEPLFIKKRVGEVLFEGWKVPLLQKIDEELGISVLSNNSFSYLMDQNDTKKGPYTISRGIKNNPMAHILEYKNSPTLPYWKAGSSCNHLAGTDGKIFAPLVDKSAPIYLFHPDLCRSAYGLYSKDVRVGSLDAYRFRPPSSILADPRESEENRCFCNDVEDEPEKCLKQGVLDLGSCRDGAPVALSLAHFLGANEKYTTDSGLSPNVENHGTFLDIEPLTGVFLNGSIKLQFSLVLKPVKGIRALSRVPDMVFPLFWADEHALLDAKTMDRIHSVVMLVQIISVVGKWGLPALATLVVLICWSRTFTKLITKCVEGKKPKADIRINCKEASRGAEVVPDQTEPFLCQMFSK